MPETLVQESGYDEGAMDEAVAIARSRVGEFVEVLGSGDADSFSVKAPIVDGDGTEHFWLNDVVLEGDVFQGVIANEPGIVGNVEMGQPWSIDREEISDWMFVRGNMIHGGFTIDPLLGSMPDEDAEAMRSRLVR